MRPRKQTSASGLHIPVTIHSNPVMAYRVPDAVEALARAWNDLDTAAVEPWLAPDVRYRSPATETVLEGIAELRAYLIHKFDRIEAVGEDARVRARPGRLPRTRASEWVVISGQGDLDRSAVFRLELDEAGRIRDITVSVDEEERRTAVEVPSDGDRDVDPEPDPR